jgi:hypothetical protein
MIMIEIRVRKAERYHDVVKQYNVEGLREIDGNFSVTVRS